MKLISMTDFVLKQNIRYANKEIDVNRLALRILNYASFLKQPLKLWMFVPCDEESNVLKEPKEEDYNMPFDVDLKAYQQAKERCLFDGFESKNGYADYQNDCLKIDEEYCENRTIEYVLEYNLQLTQTAIKQIKL